MGERLVSEAIQPVVESFDTARMAQAEPGLPQRFRWRGRAVDVAAVRRTWKSTGPCRHGSPEVYVRRHWFEVETTAGEIMKIYFERQPRGGAKAARWWLFSVQAPEDGDVPHGVR